MSNERGRLREREDQFGIYIEENTGRGWRKLRRRINDIEFNVYNPITQDYIFAMEASGIRLRLNVMSDRMELGDGPITDFQEAVILNQLQDFGMKGVARMRTAMQDMAINNKYHPVTEYLENLPEWDGMSRFEQLMDKLSMSSELADTFWRKFLIGSIAKAIDSQQNFMLVLLGGQGKGKSRLTRWLCPLPKLFFEGPINPDNKDSLIQLINHWLWEVAELDATTRRSDVAALKNFISRKIVTVRVPYGRYDIIKPATASMIGTVNPDGTQFLNDTENRRFAIIHLDDIDWSYEEIDKDMLWAELYHAYRQGEEYELTPFEREIQNEINADHVTESPLETVLIAHYKLDSSDPEEFITVNDLMQQLEDLGVKGDQFRNKMELGKVMARNGINKSRRMIDGRRQSVYEGVIYDKQSDDIKELKI
jgi:predicted P-loop ATPase